MKHHNNLFVVSSRRRLAGWCVHIFTASGAVFGLMALLAIYNHELIQSFWWMVAAMFIDSFDGLFARMIKIKLAVPQVDGELLDNIVDFMNYTIVPAFFLLVTPIVPDYWCVVCVIAITLSSAYQFTQVDAKTSDHFFKGFPSYWNIAIFYLFFWQMNEWLNFAILLFLAVLSFVPIKYIYPSRLDFLTYNNTLRFTVFLATIIWGVATAGLIWVYPKSNSFLISVSMSYIILYVVFSLYRTWVPLGSNEQSPA